MEELQNLSGLCDQPVGIREGEELDASRLTSFLRRNLDGEGPLQIAQFPSGHSNLTYRITWAEREMILRRPPFGSKVKHAHDMQREYRVLSRLHDAYPPAPKVILFCDDASVLGEPFYLMEPIRGVVLRRELPPNFEMSYATARRLSETFLDHLVLLHRLDYPGIGLSDLGKPQGYLERNVNGWIQRYCNSATHDLSEVAFLSAWLNQHLPVSSQATLLHNDYKYDNVVLDANDLTNIVGVLDWEMCTLGDPLSDLGTTLAYWTDPDDPDEMQEISSVPTTMPGTLTRAQLVERYASATGRNMANMAFYLTFARFKVAVIVQQIYYRYAHGLTSDKRFACLPRRIAALMRAAMRCAQSAKI